MNHNHRFIGLHRCFQHGRACRNPVEGFFVPIRFHEDVAVAARPAKPWRQGLSCGVALHHKQARETRVADGASDMDVGVSGVAGRYASALYTLAAESRAVDAVSGDLASLASMIEGSADLQRLIKSPVFSAEEQGKAIAALLTKAKIGGFAANFVKLVAAKRRLFVLPEMIRGYQAEVARARGIVSAQVTVAEAPSAKQVNDIKAALKEVAGTEVAVAIKVDPAIIGGLVVKMGARMVDASLKTKLNSIRLAMKEVG